MLCIMIANNNRQFLTPPPNALFAFSIIYVFMLNKNHSKHQENCRREREKERDTYSDREKKGIKRRADRKKRKKYPTQSACDK